MTQSLFFEGVTGFATLHPVFTLVPFVAAVVIARMAFKRGRHEPEPIPVRIRKSH